MPECLQRGGRRSHSVSPSRQPPDVAIEQGPAISLAPVASLMGEDMQESRSIGDGEAEDSQCRIEGPALRGSIEKEVPLDMEAEACAPFRVGSGGDDEGGEARHGLSRWHRGVQGSGEGR